MTNDQIIEASIIVIAIAIVVFDAISVIRHGDVTYEWHDFTPLFPRYVGGKWSRRLQRRRVSVGSSSETDWDWIAYRLR